MRFSTAEPSQQLTQWTFGWDSRSRRNDGTKRLPVKRSWTRANVLPPGFRTASTIVQGLFTILDANRPAFSPCQQQRRTDLQVQLQRRILTTIQLAIVTNAGKIRPLFSRAPSLVSRNLEVRQYSSLSRCRSQLHHFRPLSLNQLKDARISPKPSGLRLAPHKETIDVRA